MKRLHLALIAGTVAALISAHAAGAASPQTMVGINVVLKQDISNSVLSDLAKYGKVLNTYPKIDALTMKVRLGALPTIQQLPYVKAANEDQKRVGKPVPMNPVDDTTGGTTPWGLDQINIANIDDTRDVFEDGSDVYVAVLDTGLLSSWRYYFNENRIASEYARGFGGGGGEQGSVSSQPNKWQTDQDSHGTHVTSTIIGFRFKTSSSNRQVQGVAPLATIIPVKVLNNNGSGWSSVVAAGIEYITDLKIAGALGSRPVVINMSLGGPSLDGMEAAAIDRAVDNGVIIVASAGNAGTDGMGYPGAYDPVISVAASGYAGEWTAPSFWRTVDVPEDPIGNAYITDFSSRELEGQDLDVAAPGSWVLGPYQTNGQTSYYYLGGTSMASPHVAGVVALLVQCDSGLTAEDAEETLETTAIAFGTGPVTITNPPPNSSTESISWGTDSTGHGLVDVPGALAALGCGTS